MALKTGPVLVALTAGGLTLARRVAAHLPDAEVRRLDREAGAELRRLFQAGRPVVGCCAAGILIRALAPVLDDKRREPPVLALAEDGSAVVPLIGGHRGANRLAQEIAAVLEIAPAITTAGDLRFGLALDAPPPGWSLANPEHYKPFAAALLAGGTVRLEGDANWLGATALPFAADADLTIRATEHATAGSETCLVYYPTVLAVGIGCERNADPAEVIGLVLETLASHQLAAPAVAGIYSLDIKSDESAVHAVAERLAVPARFFDAAALEVETPRLANPSDRVFREVGCHGVAEAAALAAAGADGALVVAKTKSKRATCAVARAVRPIANAGRPRGSLAVVGIGPGAAPWRTPEAEAAIARATDLVGYRLYLDLLGPLAQGKTAHAYELGAERRRVADALDLAAAGRAVALISSGDPGIYAMAALVFELLDQGDRPEWRRPAITVVPGISALQAAAARIGAPLGHDFCAISLSDLLTPWPVIDRRLQAAAEGDFVVALYNPVSKRRTWQLKAAVDALRRHRPDNTPVVVARNLGRDGESVTVTRLDRLAGAEIDMLTVLLVGSSETRAIGRGDGSAWVYTPRGYNAAAAQDGDARPDPEAA